MPDLEEPLRDAPARTAGCDSPTRGRRRARPAPDDVRPSSSSASPYACGDVFVRNLRPRRRPPTRAPPRGCTCAPGPPRRPSSSRRSGNALPNPVEQLCMRARKRLVVRRAGMPAIDAAAFAQRSRVLHERDAFALDRVRDQHLRAIADRAEVGEDVAQRLVIVPVARLDVPAERSQLRLEVAEREDLLRRLVRLQLVAVDDDPEVAGARDVAAACRPRSSGPPGARRRRSSRRHARRGRGSAWPRPCRGPSRCPCRASPSSPRCRGRRRPGARRGRRGGAGVAAAPAR